MQRFAQKTRPAPEFIVPNSSDPDVEVTQGGLYEHTSRRDWGLAMRDAAGNEGIWYLFQDGVRRKIARTHASLMVEVDCTGAESERVLQELVAKRGLTANHAKQASDQLLVSLDQQVRLFLEDFPGGFADEGYVTTHRGGTTKHRPAQRHRDPAVARANELLGRSEMLELIDTNQHSAVIDRVMKLLASTSLVTKQQLVPLEALDQGGAARAAHALFDLLYPEADEDLGMAKSMQAWIDALAAARRGINWPLVTAAPALVQPQTHAYVQGTVYASQARWMAPRLSLDRTKPSGEQYVRLTTMGTRMHEQLELRGLSPRDRLDVYDFMRLTLLPTAIKRIAAMPPPPRDAGETDAPTEHA